MKEGRATAVRSISKSAQKRHDTTVKQARELVEQMLGRYGEPTMSLEELSESLDRHLGDIDLGEMVVQDREAR